MFGLLPHDSQHGSPSSADTFGLWHDDLCQRDIIELPPAGPVRRKVSSELEWSTPYPGQSGRKGTEMEVAVL